jgi:carboxypeptidase T
LPGLLKLQANSDGRQVAETNRNAYQRKNRNPNGSGSSCGDSYGVDLNRNFPFRWGLDTGSSGDQCAETYRGPEPASESEVQAIVQYCESIFPEGQRKSNPEEQQQVAYAEDTTMGIFFDIHSYGEFIIWPW